jgi:hypothetical protein
LGEESSFAGVVDVGYMTIVGGLGVNPTFSVNNGAQAVNVATFKDNNVPVFEILDGGSFRSKAGDGGYLVWDPTGAGTLKKQGGDEFWSLGEESVFNAIIDVNYIYTKDMHVSNNLNVTNNVSAKYFKGDGSLLTNLPAGTESDPKWTANSSTVARTGNCPAGQVVQNATTAGVQCMTPSAGAESDPKWSANFTNMQTDCPSDNYAYGVDGNGTLKCRQDQAGSGSGLTPVYLGSNLTATNANHTTIFTIALTPSKMNIIQAYLAQSSSTNGVAIQNRAIVNASGPTGICHFVTQTGAAAERINNIAVSTNSADTGSTTMSLDINVPFINTITCTVLADANQRDLIIQFESENANTVTTHAGSYYTNAVN